MSPVLPGLCRLLLAASLWVVVAQAAPPPDDGMVRSNALAIVARQRGVFEGPPVLVPTRKVPDAPLMGNGDLGVVAAGVVERLRYHGLGEAGGANVTTRALSPTHCPERLRFYLAKNDFWKTKAIYPNGHPCPIGGIDLVIPALVGGTYHAEQVLETAEVVHTLRVAQRVEDPPPFTRAGTVVRLRSWVAATTNLLVIEISVEGDPKDINPFADTALVGVDASLWAAAGNESETATGNLPDGYWAVRRFAPAEASVAVERASLRETTEAAVAMRLIGHRKAGLPWSRGDGWSADRFMVAPGSPVLVVAAVVTGEESREPVAEARRRVAALTADSVGALHAAHQAWWRDFWGRSFVEVGDPLVERYYYGSHYLMASCSRNPRFPPSLFGNWTTQDGPSWQADYHLNYNHEGPWWGVFSSNHAELADPYDAPILEYMPVARANARDLLGIRGLYYDVGIGPKGLETSFMPDGHSIPGEGRRMFLGQKSNGLFAAANMILRFRHTLDADYARRVRPFMLGVADFWEDYLRLEGGRYVITKDASGEVGDGGSDRNNALSLGLVRMFFEGLLEMSAELDLDHDRRARWSHILAHISPFPTAMVDGVRRLRGADAGPAADRIGPGRSNTRVEFMGIVWPSGVEGLGSEPAFLKVLQEDVAGWADPEWIGHFNGFSLTFPGAVRVGHDPRDILAKLRRQLASAGLPNLMVFGGGGGIENCSGVPATINEMLLQSHRGEARLFPVWPREMPARFGRLRAHGAFLFSASLRDGVVGPVTLESEKGRECRLHNPWPGRTVRVRNAALPESRVTGSVLRIPTRPGDRLVLEPVDGSGP